MNNLYPKVSVVIPSYNRIDFIAQTLDSILCQTYDYWEAIVVDDGSNDGSQEIVNNYVRKDSRIKYFERDREPKGANTCRNIGIQKSTGEYLIFLDSDDLLAPHCFEQRVRAFMENRQYDFLVFPLIIFRNKIDDLNLLFNVQTNEPEIYRFLRLDTVWITNQPIWKKEVIESLGFDEELFCWQDLDLDLRAIRKGLSYKLLFDFQPDCYWRDHDSPRITKDSLRSVGLLKSKMKIVEYVFDMYNDSKDPQIKIGVAKLMTTIIVSTLTINEIGDAFQLIEYALMRGIISRIQYLRLNSLAFLYKSGLSKIRGFHFLRTVILGNLRKNNIKWAKVKYINLDK